MLSLNKLKTAYIFQIATKYVVKTQNPIKLVQAMCLVPEEIRQ